jgi:hypothetical protein
MKAWTRQSLVKGWHHGNAQNKTTAAQRRVHLAHIVLVRSDFFPRRHVTRDARRLQDVPAACCGEHARLHWQALEWRYVGMGVMGGRTELSFSMTVFRRPCTTASSFPLISSKNAI